MNALSGNDALIVHGDTIPGNYPYIAEKLYLLLKHDPFTGINNVVERPIWLPQLHFEADDQYDGDGGTLKDQQGNNYVGLLSITEVPTAFTPAAPSAHPNEAMLSIQLLHPTAAALRFFGVVRLASGRRG